MAKCEVCGSDYHLAFQVVVASETHTFDCFECAIQRLAPVCDHCGVRVTGHGVEKAGAFYCGANCARGAGVLTVESLADFSLQSPGRRDTGAERRTEETDRLTRSEVDSGDGEMSEAEIDYNVMGTFPASDPPSWTCGIRPRKKFVSEFEGENPSANEPSHQNEITPSA